MKHYLVKAQFGHVGRNNYIIKTIPVYSEDGKEAAFKVRWMSRVKHNRKDAIIEVRECTLEEYLEQKAINVNDPYFLVHNKQEQEALCKNIDNQIISYEPPCKVNKMERVNKVKYKMKKNKILHNEALFTMRNYEVVMAY